MLTAITAQDDAPPFPAPIHWVTLNDKLKIMWYSLLSSGSSDYAKYAAWLTLAMGAIVALPHVKQFIAAALLKLYEQIIQNNSPGI